MNTKMSENDIQEYYNWLTSLRGIGPKIAERIIEAYPDYYSLAESKPKDIVSLVNGVSLATAHVVIDTIREEERRAIEDGTGGGGMPHINNSIDSNSPPSVSTSSHGNDDALSIEDIESVEKGNLSGSFEEPKTNPTVSEIESHNDDESVEDANNDLSSPKSNDDEDMTFFSKPLDFQPVRDKPPKNPVSIDEMRTRSAGNSKEGFHTFKKPDVHIIYNQKPGKEMKNVSLTSFGPLLFIIIGFGLVGASIYMLIEEDRNAKSTDVAENVIVDEDIANNTNDTIDSITIEDESQAISTTLDNAAEIVTEIVDEDIPDSGTGEDVEDPITQDPVVADVPLPADVSVVILNGNGVAGSAGSLSNILTADGFNIVSTANADNYNYTQTSLYYAEDNSGKAELVRDSLQDTYSIELMKTTYSGQTADVVVVVGEN